MKLSELKIGESAKVKEINTSKTLKDRLNYMGLTCGVSVTVIRFSPFGDPIEIKLRDFLMAIRMSDAEKILVEKII